MFAILILQIVNVPVNYDYKASIQKEVEKKYAKDALEIINRRIKSKNISELSFIPDSKIFRATKTYIILYIPSNICFTCLERLVTATVKMKKDMMIYCIGEMYNQAINGLLKYYRVKYLCGYDISNAFRKKILGGVEVKKPLAIIIQGNRIVNCLFFGEEIEKEIEIIFKNNS